MSENTSYEDFFEDENSHVKKANNKNMMLEADVSLTISDNNFMSPTNQSREKITSKYTKEYTNEHLKNLEQLKMMQKPTDDLFKFISESSGINIL